MNRNQGIIAASIVFAGAMMRPMIQSNSGDAGAPGKRAVPSAAAANTKGISGEGPWKASCSYWKPGNQMTGPDAAAGIADDNATTTKQGKPESSLNLSITENGETFDSHVSGSAEAPDAGCGTDGWAIPAPSDTDHPSIRAIIATVPDPLRSSTPWEFDRSIEVLTQAAAQYRYVGSYFWLPWQQVSAGKSGADQTGDDSQKSAKDREKLPGLLILKQENALPGKPYQFTSSDPQTTVDPHKPPQDGVLYLFLVGQSPAVGVNGEQLQNAIRYERYLNRCYGVDLSFKDHPPGTSARDCSGAQTQSTLPSALDIIGPENSGAAASLRAALESLSGNIQIQVAGATATRIAASAVSNQNKSSDKPSIQFVSFEDDISQEQIEIRHDFGQNGDRLAFLTETGTVFGLNELPANLKEKHCSDCVLSIQFPRNISFLRNAEREDVVGSDASTAAVAGPYMRLSLKDTSTDDTIPPFSATVTPYAQEAQWMEIVRGLIRANVSTVVVSASNSLDELFLVKSLHRDVPDVRVVVYDGGDLLFARVGDNQAYIGTLTFGAYPLTGLTPVGPIPSLQGFGDAQIAGTFNAAMYTFWDGRALTDLYLAGYSLVNGMEVPPPLWATAVGRDGYYPLAVLEACSSTNDRILPGLLEHQSPEMCSPYQPALDQRMDEVYKSFRTIPAFSWYLICIAITILCLAHGVFLLTADFTSPLTRDIAIRQNDEPRRRSVYIHIGAATLFCVSMITVIPIATTWKMVKPGRYTIIIALITLLSGIFSTWMTLWKTRGYQGPACPPRPAIDADAVTRRRAMRDNQENEAAFFPWFNFVALAAAFVIPLLWVYLCTDHNPDRPPFYTGLFFAYRCIYPASGVCPLLPMLLILFTWYIWASVQTRRLRFSENGRPMMPAASSDITLNLAYVPDESLGSCSRPSDSCLYENIECLLITRQLIRRRLLPQKHPWLEKHLNKILGIAYVGSFIGFLLCLKIEALANFLRPIIGGRGLYELLISGLFFPLLVVAISGCTRMVMIWTSLSAGLLAPLERSPLRFSFSRLTNVGWMTMLRQGGLFEYWLDLARSLESMQQLITLNDIWLKCETSECEPLKAAEKVLAEARRHVALLVITIGGTEEMPQPQASRTSDCFRRCIEACIREKRIPQNDALVPEKKNFLLGNDLPCNDDRRHSNKDREVLNLMCALENDCARFADLLLHCVLAPYWFSERHCLVESELPIATGFAPMSEDDENKSKKTPERIKDIYLAEEFIAIRYVSLIRAVLINIRLLMTFVSGAFVLALLAWNSYPFQPKQWVDWTFTIMLFGFGTLVVWVFAQMHRNPLLSRITGTEANQLGGDFFWRIFAYGAVPVLTWVGSVFPSVSNAVSKLLQSGFAPAR